jgi:S-adenosylmethionine-dependent methyltransferase
MLRRISEALTQDYFATYPEHVWGSHYLSTTTGQADYHDHLLGRLAQGRETVIPWLDHVYALKGATVLEVGCGTGASTVALAEQEARVTSLEVNQRHMAVARRRCDIYGLDVRFVHANAAEIPRSLRDERFDFVLFFAALEHMTHAERLAAMRETWQMVRSNGYWCVIDTPNRLWFYDSHTSQLPFYMWLPDELALAYAPFSPRKAFAFAFTELNANTAIDFARWGRGVSYHEFDLAFGDVEQLLVRSSLGQFQRLRNPLRRVYRLVARQRYHQALLQRYCGRSLHAGFFEPFLNLIIQRPRSES